MSLAALRTHSFAMELPAAKKVIPAFENLYLFKASTSIIFPLKDIFCPTLFSDATRKSLSNFRFDFSKIFIVFLPTLPVAPTIAKLLSIYFILILK